jgi:hypothetical protein
MGGCRRKSGAGLVVLVGTGGSSAESMSCTSGCSSSATRGPLFPLKSCYLLHHSSPPPAHHRPARRPCSPSTTTTSSSLFPPPLLLLLLLLLPRLRLPPAGGSACGGCLPARARPAVALACRRLRVGVSRSELVQGRRRIGVAEAMRRRPAVEQVRGSRRGGRGRRRGGRC